MKKIITLFVLTLTLTLFVTGCGNEKNLEGNLEDFMTKVYETIPDEEKPMMLMNTPIDNENVSYYLGIDNMDMIENAIASESGVGSIAHSVVLIRAKENADINKLKEEIKNNVDPRKWICVGVEEENVIVDNIGDLVILIMDNEKSSVLYENFKNLK